MKQKSYNQLNRRRTNPDKIQQLVMINTLSNLRVEGDFFNGYLQKPTVNNVFNS